MLRAAVIWGLLASGAQADLAVVTSQGAGKLSFVETTTGRVLHRVDLPGQPAALAVNARGVAVVSVGTKTLHLLALDGREIARKTLPGAPFGVAFDRASGDLLVTDAAGAGALHRLSVPGLKLLETLSAAANPTGIDSNPAGFVVVAARDADLALIYPPGCQGCRPQTVAVGHHPFGVTLEGAYAYVTNVLSDDVSVIDLVTAREVARIKTGARPYAVAFAAGRGFVSNQYDATLTVFDAASHAVIGTVETGDYPEGLSASSEGKILVASWFSDLLQVFDPASLELEQEIAMPEGPRAFGRFTTLSPGP